MDNEIVYQIVNPQQFWSELEDVIRISPSANLELLDGALKRFILLCARYHEQYLQTPLQFEHACSMLLESETFETHSGRMTNNLIQDASSNTDPHAQLVLHRLLLHYGYVNPPFLRSHKKWKPLIPILMDHLMVDFDPDFEDFGAGSSTGTSFKAGMVIPIEARLRLLSADVLYQICRFQKLDLMDLRVFDDTFISTLFDLVEQTKDMADDTLNYSIIKLMVALNEQYMLASLPTHRHQMSHSQESSQKAQNRVFVVLIRRLHFSKTFGQNIIFMLNRADTSISEDHCLQLLILKVLYLLATTPGAQEYFYINDLRVLVDVFIRNLSDLGDENDSLRHTYLRVLHPLLTNTQLKNNPYKGVQICRTLEGLVDNADIRDVSNTTKRLVERCLSGEWCLNLRRQGGMCSPTSSITTAESFSDRTHHSSSSVSGGSTVITPQGGTTHFLVTASSASANGTSTPTTAARPALTRERTLKSARSFGDLKRRAANTSQAPPIPHRSRKGGKGTYLTASSSQGGASSSISLLSVSAAEHASSVPKNGKQLNPPVRSSTDPPIAGSIAHFSANGHTRRSSGSYSNGEHTTTISSSNPSSPSPLAVSTMPANGQTPKHRSAHGYQTNLIGASSPSLTITSSHSQSSGVPNGANGNEAPKRRKPPPIPVRRAGVTTSRDIRSASVSAVAQ